jgi:T1SS-143 domain-containing protein
MPKDTNVVSTTNANKVFDIPVKLEPGQINTLSFDQDSISQMRELPNGELEIGFRDGSKVVVENFDELVNSAQSCGRDTLIQLSDNTIIYPDELAAQLAKGPVSFEGNIDAAGAVLLDQPKAGQIIEKNVQAGQEYKLGFSLDSTVSAAQAGQNLILTFKDGGVLVLKNYYTAMESDLPPAMTLADGSVIDSNALLTSCKLVEIPAVAESMAAANIAEGQVVEGVAVIEPAAGVEEPVQEVAASAARQGKAAKQAPPDIEPAAGDEPTNVANIEPAAGDAGNQPASSSRGYGFGSSIDGALLNGANPVGPIGATQLGYGANFPIGTLRPGVDTPDPFVDTQPIILSGGEVVDETNLSPTLSVSGNANVNFGANGQGSGGVTFNPSFVSGGSLAGGNLTSQGNPVTVSAVGNTYTGTANGETIFTIVLNPNTGDYTFTQFKPLDHADGTDPNDLITLQFGITATDSDGSATTGTITIGVCDDAPVAVDDGATVGGSPLTVSGNVTDNDNGGSDGATVTQVLFNGTIYTVPAVGTATIIATYGTLVIAASGAYTYTSSNTAEGTDLFTYTLTDFDGDSDTAVLSVEVTDIDTIPVVTPSVGKVDESNLAPTTGVVGSVGADFGDDGPGTFNLSTFTPGGSLAGGTLTSGGAAVTVALAGNTYTGTANGETVFTITLDPATGAYTFTQFKPLDHADGTNPNDVITLQFGVDAVDSDGDSSPTTITISVLDDAPVAANDSNTVAPGTMSVSGNVTDNDNVGQDEPGYVVTQVIFNGVPVTVPAVGTATIIGTYGTLVIDKSGAYTYTSNNTAVGIDNFTYQIRDLDGDTATAKLTIKVPDVNTKPVIGDSHKSVDETNLGPNVVTGTIPGNFGADGPGTFTLTDFNFGGSVKNGTLSSCGDLVTVTVMNGAYVGIDADGVTVFTLTINSATGEYVFTQFKGLDHADANDPNDYLTLSFTVTGTDEDGDTDTGVISIKVFDDGPRADDDYNTFDSNAGSTNGNVITGLNGGPGADDVLSKDGANKVTSVSFKGVEHEVPASGETTVNGDYGTLVIKSDGSYTYTLYDGSGSGTGPGTDGTFSETAQFPTLSESVPVGDALKGVDASALDITASATGNIKIISEGAGYSNTLGLYTIGADGTIQAAQVIAANVNNMIGGGASFDIPANGTGVGFFLIADGFTLNGGYADKDLSTGNVVFYANYGEAGQRIAKVTDNAADITLVYVNNGVEEVLSGPVYHTTDRGGSNAINPDGKVHTVSGLADGTNPSILRISFEDLPDQGDKDFNDVVFDFSYTPSGPQDSVDEFVYTITDCDGDSDKALLVLDSKDMVDDKPVLVGSVKTVDETIVDNNGSQTVNGTVTANFGADVPGPIVATGPGSFAFSGSTNGSLTSNGVPVVVTLVGNQYVGKAGDTVIFTLTINANGSFAYTQSGQLDHADKTNPDDVITLNFGVQATDGDGDTGTANITINVRDDGPVAENDFVTIGSPSATFSGNVTDNDDVGLDEPGYVVSQVTFGATTVNVPATGTITITGAHGKLTIGANGAYTYQATSAGEDRFFYKIVDQDGDSATAKLAITVEGRDDKPTIKNVAVSLDETDLGPLSVSGNTHPNFFGDGPGTVKASGASTFVAGGSLMGGKLTSGGVAVVVTLDAATNTYIGKAGNSTVFNIKINNDGTFKFTLFDNLDHGDPKDPNDAITLKFGVVAHDADDDVATGTITVTVKDDAPLAKNDYYEIEACNCAKIGNVLLNDKIGQDEVANAVKSVWYNGKTYDVAGTGSTTINAANGKLTLNADGSFLYKPHANACGTDDFKYTVADYDKDTSTAHLTFSVDDGKGYGGNTTVVVNTNVTIDGTINVESSSSSSSSSSSYSSSDILLVLENTSKMTISDFDPGEGDIIDLSSLVQGYDPVTDAINDFVFARTEGKDTVLSVDPEGKGSSSQSYDVAVIKDVTGVHVEDIVSLGNQQQNQGGLGTV